MIIYAWLRVQGPRHQPFYESLYDISSSALGAVLRGERSHPGPPAPGGLSLLHGRSVGVRAAGRAGLRPGAAAGIRSRSAGFPRRCRPRVRHPERWQDVDQRQRQSAGRAGRQLRHLGPASWSSAPTWASSPRRTAGLRSGWLGTPLSVVPAPGRRTPRTCCPSERSGARRSWLRRCRPCR